MIFGLLLDITKMALIVAGLYFAFGAYVRRRQQARSGPRVKRRVAILLALVLVVSVVKVSEEVFGGESGPIDMAILVFIHRHVPSTWTGIFEVVTLTGSDRVLVPLTVIGTIALLFARRRFEAWLLAASVIGGEILVYLIKTVVGRARPELWETKTYWGSSFPSGHTLIVAAFATAVVLCVDRIRPAAYGFALSIALVWISIVALSRLVLGVHWPTDVLAAACLGAMLPLAMSSALRFRST